MNAGLEHSQWWWDSVGAFIQEQASHVHPDEWRQLCVDEVMNAAAASPRRPRGTDDVDVPPPPPGLLWKRWLLGETPGEWSWPNSASPGGLGRQSFATCTLAMKPLSVEAQPQAERKAEAGMAARLPRLQVQAAGRDDPEDTERQGGAAYAGGCQAQRSSVTHRLG